MLPSTSPEVCSSGESTKPIAWEAIEIADPDGLIDELLEFWSRQSLQDIYFRFCSQPDMAEIRRRYHHAFRYTRFAISLRDTGRLVGMALGSVSPSNPDWVSLSMEIDFNYRRRGLAFTATKLLYQQTMECDYHGLDAEILYENHPSRGVLAKFCKDKPHEISYNCGMTIYHVGNPVHLPISIDLL